MSGQPGPLGKLWRWIFHQRLPLETETARFILVSVLDVVMTYILLSVGGFRESNPFADYFIDHWGAKGMIYFKMGLVAFVTVLAQIIARHRLAAARWVLNLGTAAAAVVVAYSFGLFLKYVA